MKEGPRESRNGAVTRLKSPENADRLICYSTPRVVSVTPYARLGSKKHLLQKIACKSLPLCCRKVMKVQVLYRLGLVRKLGCVTFSGIVLVWHRHYSFPNLQKICRD
jgi:hypothetical protein